MKEWFSCPVCHKKLSKVDPTKNFEGVYLQCPKCKREVEITNKKEPRSQSAVAS